MLLINMKLTSWHFLFTAPNQFYFERMSLLLEIGALKFFFFLNRLHLRGQIAQSARGVAECRVRCL